MGKRGPPRTPTSVLKLRGSWRAAARGDEPTPQPQRPECPEWLSADERAVWDHVVELLESMRVLTVADGAQLERYCRYLVRWWHSFLGYDQPAYAQDWKDGARNTLTTAVTLNRPDIFDAAVA